MRHIHSSTLPHSFKVLRIASMLRDGDNLGTLEPVFAGLTPQRVTYEQTRYEFSLWTSAAMRSLRVLCVSTRDGTTELSLLWAFV